MPGYDAVLALHLLAVTAFVATLLLVSLLLPGAVRAADRTELARLRTLNRLVGTPALLLVWACGLTMAIEAGWFASGWLRLKLVLVALLTVQHLRHARVLARSARGDGRVTPPGRAAAALVLAVAGILVLVFAKPF